MTSPKKQTPNEQNIKNINIFAFVVKWYMIICMTGFVLAVIFIMPYDRPQDQFMRWWNGDKPKDIIPKTYIDVFKYDYKSNILTLSIYNGNYHEFERINHQCSDFITRYNSERSDLESKLSTFYVSIHCVSKNYQRVFPEKDLIQDFVVIPFNSTYNDIEIDFPYSTQNGLLCDMTLFSNFINIKEDGCFLSLKEPVISKTLSF